MVGGNLFIFFDIVSGPLSFTFNLFYLFNENQYSVRYADVMIIFRIFCVGRIRLLILDIIYIIQVSKVITLATFLIFYFNSYFAYRMFQNVAHDNFNNLFMSMVSMFQVLTCDDWNGDINQSVSSHYGQIWGLFFVFFILFMFFYLINLLLGAFVSYYSNPSQRINYDYDFEHDDILNPVLLEEKNQTIDIAQTLVILDIKHDDLETHQYNQGLGIYHIQVYTYIFAQLCLEFLVFTYKTTQVKNLYVATELLYGLFFCYVCWIKIQEHRKFNMDFVDPVELQTDIQKASQILESNIRLYVVVLLLIGGPLATIIDLVTISQNQGPIILQYGPGARVFVVLAVNSVQGIIFKFVQILPGITHFILFTGGLLFSLTILSRRFIDPLDYNFQPPILKDMTSTYLFLLQVVTFDSWGGIAREIVNKQGVFFVLYFIFLVIFIGFFLMNMLLGIIATMTQPKTQELFEKRHIMSKRVNQAAVHQLKKQIDMHHEYEKEKNDPQIILLKELLESFNESNNMDEKLIVYVNGQKFKVTTKNLLYFDKYQ